MPLELRLQAGPAAALAGLLAGNRTHSLLISGEPSNGPLAAARWFAAVALAGPEADADHAAAVARRVERESHPDLIVARPEGEALRVVEIEATVSQVVHAPFEAGMQVVVVHGAETLSPANADAANRLLKVLEEPPGEVVFLLLTQSAGAVLETIRSRCVHVPFHPPAIPTIESYLSELGASGGLPTQAAAALSRGSFGRAAELASGEDALDRLRICCRVLAGQVDGSMRPADGAALLLARAGDVERRAREAAEEAFERERERLPERDARRLSSASAEDGHPKRAKRIGRQARASELAATLDELAAILREAVAHGVGAPNRVGLLPESSATLAACTSLGSMGAHGLEAIAATRGRLALNTNAETALSSLCTELQMLGSGRVIARRALGVSG